MIIIINISNINIKTFRKSGFARRNTITQNEFWANVCRLPHSRRKRYSLTPKRCLDWWCCASFFLRLCQEVLLRGFRWFFFFRCSFCRKRKGCRVRQPAPWMKQAAAHSRTNQEECLLPLGWTSSVGLETSILPLMGFARFTLPVMSFFSFDGFLFLRIFSWSLFYPICLCFRLPPFLRLSMSRIRQSFPFWAQR